MPGDEAGLFAFECKKNLLKNIGNHFFCNLLVLYIP